MNQRELNEFIDEFTYALNGQLKDAAQHFPKNFNGLHVRYLAQQLTKHSQDSIRDAGKEVEQLEINLGRNLY